jgi:hypothetical protein
VDSVDFGVLWDEYGIIGELVVCPFGTTGLLETDSTLLSELSPSPSTSNSSDFRFLTLSDAASIWRGD